MKRLNYSSSECSFNIILCGEYEQVRGLNGFSHILFNFTAWTILNDTIFNKKI